MGNNAAYATFQQTIITLYDHEKLDLATLDALAEEYRDTDIDSGGDTGLLARDGRDLETICIATVFPEWAPQEPTEEQVSQAASTSWHRGDRNAARADLLWEQKYAQWCLLTEVRWGWR